MNDDEEIREFLLEQSRSWLQHVIESTGLSANAIAKKAKVSPANLNKLLNNPDFHHPMSETVKLKISRATGVPTPGDTKPRHVPSGLSEPEMVPLQPQSGPSPETDMRNGLDWWEVQTELLDLDGFLPGDIVLVDRNQNARSGDIVIAQISADGGRRIETVLRKFMPPMLTCHCTARVYPKPEYVDGERVMILGVVVELRRDMRSAAA